MAPQPAFLGIEGGGTKGRASVYQRGRALARIIPSGLNPSDVGYAAFETGIRSLVIPLLGRLEAKPDQLSVCVALAGAGSPQVAARCQRIVRAVLRPLARELRVRVMGDAHALVETLLAKQSGVVLIAGTGSICLGTRQTTGGRVVARLGGWGACFDRGSGFWLGTRVLDAALRTLDTEPATSRLVGLICQRYGLRPEDIPRRFLPPERREIAGLARVALDAYAAGDPAARSWVREGVRDLAGMVLAAKRKAHLRGRVRIVLSGGLFESPVVARLLRLRIKRSLPEASLIEVREPLLHVLALAGAPLCEASGCLLSVAS